MSTPHRDHQLFIERMGSFVESPGWHEMLACVEDEVIQPLRARALNTPDLDPRAHTGIVCALAALKQMLELPYHRLAKARGVPVDIPSHVKKLFE